MSEPIRHEVTLAAAPSTVYGVLTGSARFSEMSGGAPAELDDEPGSAFSCFGGMIHGRTIEAVEDARLVQAWRAKTWPAGQYSIVRFELEGAADGATVLRLEQSGHPAEQSAHLSAGWVSNYLDPMRAYLEP